MGKTSKKRISKVWRKTYAHSCSDYDDQEAPEQVYLTFSDPFQQDVTQQYMTGEIILDDSCHHSQYTYLCTYRTGADWTPVAYSRNGISFGAIGDSTVYLLAHYKAGKLIPITHPMIAISPGITKILNPDTTVMTTVTIYRKYPLVGKFIDRWAQMRGGRFEGSGSPSFDHRYTIAEITTTPVYRNVYTVNTSKAYRYIRYVSPEGNNFPITELELYSGGHKLNGAPFSSGIDTPERAFDGDRFKTLENATPGYSVGLDFGKIMKVDSIIMYPQNDDNFVIPGLCYELLYYDQGWISLGKTIPAGYSVTYRNVPSNALLLLRCHDGGHEERIFTWADGTQIWW